MKKLFQKLWDDQGGFILSTEAMILWTIVVLGMVTGLVAVRDAAVLELTEVANAIVTFDQSYGYQGVILNLNNPLFPPIEAQTNGSNAQDYAGTTGGLPPVPTWYTLSQTGEAIPAANTALNIISIDSP
jgi:hypothetical protein